MLRLILAVIVAALAAAAQQVKEDSPCPAAVTTLDMRVCLSKALDAADSELNAAYTKIRARLDGEDAKRLIVAQRLWVQFRDANCTASRELYAGGTLAPVVYLACLDGMTRARTKDLLATYRVRLE